MCTSKHPRVVHWRKEPHDVLIDRSTEWGNPFSHKEKTKAKFKTHSVTESLILYQEWVLGQPDLIKKIKACLRGKILGCWCKGKRCHGYVLLAIANDLPLPFNRTTKPTTLFD